VNETSEPAAFFVWLAFSQGAALIELQGTGMSLTVLVSGYYKALRMHWHR